MIRVNKGKQVQLRFKREAGSLSQTLTMDLALYDIGKDNTTLLTAYHITQRQTQ